MHFNRGGTVTIIISSLREIHLYRNFSPRATIVASTGSPLVMHSRCFGPPVLFAQVASTLSVPLPSNLINVPAQRERKPEGLRFVIGRMAIRALTRRSSLSAYLLFTSTERRTRNVQFVHTLYLMSHADAPSRQWRCLNGIE